MKNRRAEQSVVPAKATGLAGLSQTQQTVYLDGGNVTGFHMKLMAMKLRHKMVSRRQGSKDLERDSSTDMSLPSKQDSYRQVPLFEKTLSDGPELTDGERRITALKSIVVHPFSFLLLAYPVAIWAHLSVWSPLSIFWLSLISLIPLAKFLGDATEELADAIKNDTLSGLINATLGNLVEMILTAQTLRKGLLNVVKATLLGSMLSNLLLVLGSSFFLGGFSASPQRRGPFHIIHLRPSLRGQASSVMDSDYNSSKQTRRWITLEKEQIFTVKGALVNTAMHFLAIMTIALPTLFAHQGEKMQKESLLLSRYGAIVILVAYAAYIVFHLFTHKNMLAMDEAEAEEDAEDEENEAGLGAFWALMLMSTITALIGYSSELLVEAMDEVVRTAGMPPSFIGVILLPFAGNACEHASALRFAIIDRPGLSIGIAVGSSTQIALLVVPFSVVMGWYLNQPMDLNFGYTDLTILFLSTLVVLATVLDGRSNWLKGFLLINAYVFVGILYWFTGEEEKMMLL